jgi:hypothetical protein
MRVQQGIALGTAGVFFAIWRLLVLAIARYSEHSIRN